MPSLSTEANRQSDVPLAGLYIHVPFCSAICPYCDFAVLVGGHEQRRHFVDSLLLEIALYADLELSGLGPVCFDTIYLGGGTPSMLTPDDLGRIFDALRRTVDLTADAKISLEANPEDVTSASLQAWRRLGVATLSLGVQSFDGDELRVLGRRHSPEDAIRSIKQAVAAGFDSVSVDLIFGLPDQDTSTLRRNLEQAVALAPDHISSYELEIHPRTTFGKQHARGELHELPEGQQAELFLLTHRVLAEAGYPAYEVSNFARHPRYRSQHNQKYWRHVPYVGLGPSAHSFDGQQRWWNERHLAKWQRQIEAGHRPVAGRERLSTQDLALETLMLSLRTVAGLDLSSFEARFDFDLVAHNRALVEQLDREGLLRLHDNLLAPTLEGFAVADGLAAGFSLQGLGRQAVRSTSRSIDKRLDRQV